MIELVEAFSAPLPQFDSSEEAAEWFKSGTAFEDMQRAYSQLAFDAMGGCIIPGKNFMMRRCAVQAIPHGLTD